jgi:4-hydroxy-tetrahydrodipicolinate synthase
LAARPLTRPSHGIKPPDFTSPALPTVTTMCSIGRHVSRLSGYAPALPTPFAEDGEIDRAAFEKFCDLQIHAGATALVVCGTTGEAPTLRPAEHHVLVRIAVDVANSRVPVIAGAGSNSTAHAVGLSKDAEAAGADAILSVVPYYNKPTQAGMAAHFSAIARSTGLPLILYDVPSRTGCGLSEETVALLTKFPQIIGLKDATGDIARVKRLRCLLGDDFGLLSGDDATASAFIAEGGNGCISVTSNVAPGLCREIFLACHQGHFTTNPSCATAVAKLTRALFCETSPAPLKYALSLLGLMSSRMRLPLVELSAPAKEEVKTTIGLVWEAYSEYAIGQFDGQPPQRCSTRLQDCSRSGSLFQ